MATIAAAKKYNVGGIALDRPFKVRRLGHFGFNVNDMEAGKRFYFDLLGFRITEPSGNGWFGRHGSDHHALALFDKKVYDERFLATDSGRRHYRPENDVNQITWQVQSVEEMVQATSYFRERGYEIIREGRAGGPGAQYHLYVYDPDDQVVELYYGIEQVGWDGYARPKEMRHGTTAAPTEPVQPEGIEVSNDLEKGIDPRSGYRWVDPLPVKYSVDGLLLPRPFKIIRIGPVKLFCDDVEESLRYWRDVLGFVLTEEVTHQGERCYFLRCDNEHHSVGLFPKTLRSALGLSPNTSNMSVGLQVANYRQLRDAVDFLRDHGVRVETNIIPAALHPGIDYAAYAFDSDGHCLELYYYMEQVGWDGKPRPQALRRQVDPQNWPEVLEPLSDTYTGEPFIGPWA